MFRSETISTSIDCPWQEVYEFLAEPLNLPTWGSNMGISMMHASGNDWMSDTPDGRFYFRYHPRNAFGILDHSVFREGDEPVTTPMRVFANGDGAELTYTLFQRASISDEQFRSDIEWARADLLALKSLLESKPTRR